MAFRLRSPGSTKSNPRSGLVKKAWSIGFRGLGLEKVLYLKSYTINLFRFPGPVWDYSHYWCRVPGGSWGSVYSLMTEVTCIQGQLRFLIRLLIQLEVAKLLTNELNEQVIPEALCPKP